MDIGRSFSAFFEDPKWAGKVVLAFVFSVLVVTAPAVIGWWMRYVRNVAEGRDGVLPEWGQFGAFWVRGILVVLSAIVYVVVGLLLLVIGIVPALILFQGACIEYAMTERAGSLFAIKSVFRRITTVTAFWIAWLIGVGLGFGRTAIVGVVQSPATDTARVIGFVIGAALGIYVSLVQGDLYGQYAREAYIAAAPPQQPYAPAAPPPPPPPPSGNYTPPPVPQG